MAEDFHNGTQETQVEAEEETHGAVLVTGFRGRVRFAGGREVAVRGLETVRLDDPAEPFSGVMVLTTPEGDVGWQRFEGRASGRDAEGALVGRAVWSWAGGAGVFAGLTGGGEMDWRFKEGQWRATFTGAG